MKCTSCGTENPEGSRFCMSCASPLAGPPPVIPTPPPFFMPPSPVRRHRQPHEDLVGLLGLAFFLLAVSAVFAWNPNLLTQIQEWSRLAAAHNTIFVRPPEGIITSGAWFFTTIGILEIAAAGIRWALRWTHLRVAGRFLSGVGDLVLASLLFLYSARTIDGTFLVAILAGTIGILLMIFVSLGVYWSSARSAPRSQTTHPPTRQ